MISRAQLFVALMAIASGLHAQTAYKGRIVKDGGRIHGVVQLVGDPPPAFSMGIDKDDKVCGMQGLIRTLAVSKKGGVKNAVVSIEGIWEGKKPAAELKAVLHQKGCVFEPHVLLIPPGASLDVVNNDPVLHNVHTYDLLNGNGTVFNIAQPIKGQRTPIKLAGAKVPGILHVRCDAGHPWMSSYIVIAEHPYYILTDADGLFSLDNIPPGTYRLRMWHEGVSVIRTDKSGGRISKIHFEEPYVLEQEVVVPPHGSVAVNFALALRNQQQAER